MWLNKLFILFAFSAGPVSAQNWLLVEVRDLPQQCTQPVSCISQSELALRNLMHLPRNDRNALLQILNSASTIRGLSDEDPAQSVGNPADMIPVLQSLPKAEKLAPLIDHPGVFFDSKSLDGKAETADFAPYIRKELSKAGVRFLTKEEWEATPGRPTLSVRYSPRSESAGCIIPFSVSLAISEETVMVRNPSIKVSGNAWSGLVKENLANLNFTRMSALSSVVEKFVRDWTSQNPKN